MYTLQKKKKAHTGKYQSQEKNLSFSKRTLINPYVPFYSFSKNLIFVTFLNSFPWICAPNTSCYHLNKITANYHWKQRWMNGWRWIINNRYQDQHMKKKNEGNLDRMGAIHLNFSIHTFIVYCFSLFFYSVTNQFKHTNCMSWIIGITGFITRVPWHITK
jgi:hypothetical protein